MASRRPDRHDAEVVATRIDRDNAGPAPARGGSFDLSQFLTDTWMPLKRRHVRATTAYRYAWFIDRYINPAIGHVPLRRLRPDHLDDLYEQLATSGGRNGTGLAPKPCTRSTWSCAPRSTSQYAASSSTATSPTPPQPPAASHAYARSLLDRPRTRRFPRGVALPAALPRPAPRRVHRYASR